MASPILITSFRPWKAHQKTNTSDLLLERLATRLPVNTILLRWLPVNFDLAPMQVINHIVQYRPNVIICCGMAERRQTLTVEQWGTYQDRRLATPIDLQTLINQTIHTRISYDAGSFVCNRLYYRVLHHLRSQSSTALFIHVPLMTAANQAVIEFDFLKIVDYLNSKSQAKESHPRQKYSDYSLAPSPPFPPSKSLIEVEPMSSES